MFNTPNSVDIVENIHFGGVILEVYHGFICHNMQYNPYVDFVNDLVGKRDLFKNQGKDWSQTLFKKCNNSVYGRIIRRIFTDQL